jgi:hypothetical protein
VIKVFATLIKVFAKLIKVFARLIKVVIRLKTRHYACMTCQCLQVVLSCHLSRSCALMSASRWMSPSQSHLREQPRQSSSHQPPPRVQYKTIQGCIVSRPGWHIDRPRISLQSVSQGLISGFGGLSYHLDKLGKQLTNGGRSSMVAENQAPRLRLAGRWNKDKSASDMDGYGKSLDLMGIHGAFCPPCCTSYMHARTCTHDAPSNPALDIDNHPCTFLVANLVSSQRVAVITTGIKKRTAMVMMDGVEIIQDDAGEPVLRACDCLMSRCQINNI